METEQALHLTSLKCWLEDFLDQIWFSCLGIPLVGWRRRSLHLLSLSVNYFFIKSKHNPFCLFASFELQLNGKHVVPFLSSVFVSWASRRSSVSRMWKSNNFYSSHLFPGPLHWPTGQWHKESFRSFVYNTESLPVNLSELNDTFGSLHVTAVIKELCKFM